MFFQHLQLEWTKSAQKLGSELLRNYSKFTTGITQRMYDVITKGVLSNIVPSDVVQTFFF